MAPTTSSTRNVISIPKALKSGASIIPFVRRVGRPVTTSTGPTPGEQPSFLLKLQIVSCNGLLGVDRSGKSDPYVVASLLHHQFQTPAISATLDPVFAPASSTFEFPVYLSQAEYMGALELIIWDRNLVFKKEYLGEINIPVEDWFGSVARTFDDPANEPITYQVQSTKDSRPPTGTITFKLGLVAPNPENPDVDGPYQQLVRKSQGAALTLISAPPTEGIGTVRSDDGHEPQDDGLSSDDETDDEIEREQPSAASVIASVAPVAPAPGSSSTQIAAPAPKPGILPRLFSSRKSSLAPSQQDKDAPSGSPSRPSSTTGSKAKRPKFKRSRGTKDSSYNLGAEKDVLGIVLLEVNKAQDLPKLPNMTKTGWDMDPFVVISFGKKVFRTRVLRHTLNPSWDEKLLFHVRRYESAFAIQFTLLDWDKLSGNDLIAETILNVDELIKAAPTPDANTGLYPESAYAEDSVQTFTLPLTPNKDAVGNGNHSPTITFKAKYQPYDMLRQKFWSQYIKQYDSDDTGAWSHVEITSMLDSLGSTLSRETVDSWFSRFGKNPLTQELIKSELIQCLEEETTKPASEKKPLSQNQDEPITAEPSVYATPTYEPSPGREAPLQLDKLDFTGPEFNRSPDIETAVNNADPSAPSGNTQILDDVTPKAVKAAIGLGLDTLVPVPPITTTAPTPEVPHHQESLSSYGDDDSSGSGSDDSVERVINIRTCPLCHRPRLNSKGEMDIVTHLAVCASQDWQKVESLSVANYVTASQAQRKWYTKVIGKLSSGAYSIGANSANIIVQNRLTGQLEEEKMQVYVRLGIRLLYKGAKSRMEGARARNLLKSMSIKQGIKFNDPESAKEIPAFIEFHNLKVNEIRDPLTSFKNFNEFFYRKLKEDARPVTEPDNPKRVVSAADCRLVAFETVSEATRIWIKGREFTVARLLGENHKDEVHKYNGGALVIFRLAPQDYHRYHSPVDGKIGPMTYIDGEYYTVNPQAIRTTLDVYGENVRKIVPIDSPIFGRVFNVCIGAMMVGTIQTTVNEGDQIARGEEFGYFAFGGSTIVTIFEKGAVTWDPDLLENSSKPLETLVRVGMGIGKKIE